MPPSSFSQISASGLLACIASPVDWRCNAAKVNVLAEAQGFEPWTPFGLPVFKTGAIDHSAKLPGVEPQILTGQEQRLKVAQEIKASGRGLDAAGVVVNQALGLGLGQTVL